MNVFDRKEELSLHPLRAFYLSILSHVFDSDDFTEARDQSIPEESRDRILVPQILFYLYAVTPLCDSFAHALESVCQLACSGNESVQSVTASAFCHARRSLPIVYLRTLFDRLIGKLTNRFEEEMKYRGYQLLGVDGTRFDLPSSDQLTETFGGPTNQDPDEPIRPQAMMVGVVNLLTGVCLDYLVGPYKSCEESMFRTLLSKMTNWFDSNPSIFLFDQGFFGHKTLISLINSSSHFLMKVPKNIGKTELIKQFGCGDRLLLVRTSPALLKKNPSLPAFFKLRVIRFQIPGFDPILIGTDLSWRTFSTREIAGLYHWRWRIEVFYDEIKNTLSVSDLRSKKPGGIRKEILTQLTFNNAVRYIMIEATEDSFIPTIGYSFTRSCRTVKNYLTIMAVVTTGTLQKQDAASISEKVNSLYESMLTEIRRFKIPKRPGRHHEDNQPSEELLEPVDDDLYFFEDYVDFKEVSRNYSYPDKMIG